MHGGQLQLCRNQGHSQGIDLHRISPGSVTRYKDVPTDNEQHFLRGVADGEERTRSLSEGKCETCDTIIGPCSTSPLALQLYTDLTLSSVLSFSAELCVPDHTSIAHALAQGRLQNSARRKPTVKR